MRKKCRFGGKLWKGEGGESQEQGWKGTAGDRMALAMEDGAGATQIAKRSVEKKQDDRADSSGHKGKGLRWGPLCNQKKEELQEVCGGAWIGRGTRDERRGKKGIGKQSGGRPRNSATAEMGGGKERKKKGRKPSNGNTQESSWEEGFIYMSGGTDTTPPET